MRNRAIAETHDRTIAETHNEGVHMAELHLASDFSIRGATTIRDLNVGGNQVLHTHLRFPLSEHPAP